MQKSGIADKLSQAVSAVDAGSAGAKNEKGAMAKLQRALCNPFWTFALIILICGITFGRTLGSFFIADDIGEIRYIHQIFDGRWDLFWSNFSGNYMQVPNMSVYRPMLLLTLVFDYLIWKENPFGYYLSNLFYFAGSACLLSIFVRQLCSSWGKGRAALAGLASAVLFACNPLHCESISWVVGRVDSACCLFYLAAICVFMHRGKESRKRQADLLTAIGISLFVLAICVKEMAIGLAPVIAGLAFFFPEKFHGWNHRKLDLDLLDSDPSLLESAGPRTTNHSFKSRLNSAWKASRSIWLATGLYFGVRFLTLHTLLGGYNGSVGESQSASALIRWFDLDNWHRLLMPLPFDLFAPGNNLAGLMLIAYCGLFFLVCLRFISNSIPWRWLAFLSFWGLTQAAPIYRLFGVGANLEGARFCFFLSLSMSCVLPFVLLSPENKFPKLISKRLTACSLVLLAMLAYTLQKSAYATNLLWLHAGREVKAVFDDALNLSKTCKDGEKVILLGIPKEHSGAHMILNGPTLQMLLTQPFTDKDRWQPLLTFDSVLFGNENTIDSGRLRQLANKKGYRGPYVWSNASKHFVEVKQANRSADDPQVLSFPLTPPSTTSENPASTAKLAPHALGHGEYSYANAALVVDNPKDNDGLRISGLKIHPLAFSHLKISFRSSNNSIDLPFQVRWKGSQKGQGLKELQDSNIVQKKILADPKASSGTVRSIFIPLGQQWRWYGQSEVSELSIFLPAVEQLSLTEISLISPDKASPSIQFQNESGNNFGVIDYTKPRQLLLSSNNGGPIKLQVSKKEFFFENMDERSDAGIEAEYRVPANSKSFTIPDATFKGNGYYQVRAQALDSANNAVSEFSDPLTLMVVRN